MERRKYGRDKQPKVMKEDYELHNLYATDIDDVKWVQDASFCQYEFANDMVIPTRLIEIKHDATDFVADLVRGRIPPTPQIKCLLAITKEMNAGRSLIIPDAEPCVLNLVVQTNGDYPFYVFDVYEKEGRVKYDFMAKLENLGQYKAFFEPSS